MRNWNIESIFGKDNVANTASQGLVVSVPDYRSIGPGFDSRRYQMF
jgi:hypothetical protein